MFNFISLSTKEIYTAAALKMLGINIDDIAEVHKAGYAIVKYEHPEYDDTMYRIRAEEKLTKAGDDFIQRFDVIPLDADIVLENAKNKKRAVVSEKCEEYLRELVSQYPDAETETFYRQEREAREIVSGNEPSTHLLESIAEAREITLEALANKVITKADAYAKACGEIIGKRQYFYDLIDAATNIDALNEICVSSGCSSK